MKKNWKFWAIIFTTVYAIFVLVLFKAKVQDLKHDEKYNELGLDFSDDAQRTIKNLQITNSSKKNELEDIKNKSAVQSFDGKKDGLLEINKYMISNSQTQQNLNESLNKIDTTYQKTELDDNFKINLQAIPFTIKWVNSDKYYPDEHVIIKRGEVGVNKVTSIDKLVKEEVVKNPVSQTQYLGTKKYIKVPNLDSNETFNYDKLIKNQKLKYKENIINDNIDKKAKFKKVFISFDNEEQLNKLKENTQVQISVKWLSKKEYDDKIAKKKAIEKQRKDFIDGKNNAIKKINEFKYLNENEKTNYLNQISAKSVLDQINQVLKKAQEEENKAAVHNGVGTGKYLPPVEPATMSAGVAFHLANESLYAVDYSPPGSYPGSHKITASDSGVVIKASWDGPYGNCVIVDHNNGYLTRYAHLNSFTVNVGDKVAPQEQLGWIGTTGNSTGTHVHFEIIKGAPGNTVDPRPYGLGY